MSNSAAQPTPKASRAVNKKVSNFFIKAELNVNILMLILLLDDYFTWGLIPQVLSWIVNSSTRVAPPMGMLTDGQVEDRHIIL